MGRRWMTGKMVMDEHNLVHAEIFGFIIGGLPAYLSNLRDRYYPVPLEVETGDMFHGTPEEIEKAYFRPEEIEEAVAKIEGNPLPSERIVELEGQIAMLQQEKEALLAEVEKMEKGEPVDVRRKNSYLAVIAGAICKDETTGPLRDSKRAGMIRRNMERLNISRKPDTIKSILTEAAEFVEKKKEDKSQ